jgi:hypothetical protein
MSGRHASASGPAGTVDYKEFVSRGQVNAMASFCRLSVTLKPVIIAAF